MVVRVTFIKIVHDHVAQEWMEVILDNSNLNTTHFVQFVTNETKNDICTYSMEAELKKRNA